MLHLALLSMLPALSPWVLETPRAQVNVLVDEHAIVRLAAGAAIEDIVACGAHPVRVLSPELGLWLVASARASEDGGELAARLERCEGPLRYAVPNLWLRHRLTWTPDDPRFAGQWYLEDLDMQRAWDLSRGDASTTIVVVDNGCEADHPDLAAKLDPGRDVVDQDDDPSPASSSPGSEHGTACAGLVGAETSNAVGIAGACPECRVRCVRLLPASGELVPLSADVEAFQFALDVGAAVVSNSWGFVEAIPAPAPLRDIIEHVHDNGRGGLGAVVAFAAGNDDRELGDEELTAVRGVLNVGAVNTYGEKTPFTNFGPSLDLVAPAGTVTTDLVGAAGGASGDYTSGFGGTSSACPVAAGIAALVASAAPSLRAAEIDALLLATVTPAVYAAPNAAGHDPVYGHGVINAVGALERALGITHEQPPASEHEESGCAATGAGFWPILLIALLWRSRPTPCASLPP